jgi:hypothetical protein
MKKVLIAAGAFSALAMALPAAAQPYGGDGIHQQFQRLEMRIERGVERGVLTRQEARGLRHEFRQLVHLDAQYRRDGLSRWEYADLDRRVQGLQARIRWERRDGEQRYGRYDARGGYSGYEGYNGGRGRGGW